MRIDGKLARSAIRRFRNKDWAHTPEKLVDLFRTLGEPETTVDTMRHWIRGTGYTGMNLRKFQMLSRATGLSPNELLLEDDELQQQTRQEAIREAKRLVDEMFERELGDLDTQDDPNNDGSAPSAGVPLPQRPDTPSGTPSRPSA